MTRSDSSVVAPLIIILLLLLGDTNCDGRGRRLLRRPDLTVTGSAASSSSGVREGEAARATCLPMLPSGDKGTEFASCSWVDPSGEVIVASKEDYRRNRSRCSLFKLITYECSTERCFFYFLTKEKKEKRFAFFLPFPRSLVSAAVPIWMVPRAASPSPPSSQPQTLATGPAG